VKSLPVVLAGLLLSAGAVVLPATPAAACSCVRAPGDGEAAFYDEADVVFAGEMVERRDPPFSLSRSSADLGTRVFEVATVFKGSASRRQGVLSPVSGASCGLELPTDRRVLVFARERGDHGSGLMTSLCDGSRRLARGDVPFSGGGPPAAGASYPRTGGAPVAAIGAAVGAGLVVAVLAGLAGRRRRGPSG